MKRLMEMLRKYNSQRTKPFGSTKIHGEHYVLERKIPIDVIWKHRYKWRKFEVNKWGSWKPVSEYLYTNDGY